MLLCNIISPAMRSRRHAPPQKSPPIEVPIQDEVYMNTTLFPEQLAPLTPVIKRTAPATAPQILSPQHEEGGSLQDGTGNESPQEFYDVPSTFNLSTELPPLPDIPSPLGELVYQDGSGECLYEGIPDEQFYEGIQNEEDECIYEGVEDPIGDDEYIYEGVEDPIGDDECIYEGVEDTIEEEGYYEGLPGDEGDNDGVFGERAHASGTIESDEETKELRQLITSLKQTDAAPYVPPKPPPVPIRRPPGFKPPDPPGSADGMFGYRSGSFTQLSNPPAPLALSMSLADVVSVIPSSEGEDDGLYDGIDCDSEEEGEGDESGSGKKDASQEGSQDSNEVRKRLFSSKQMRKSVKKTRERTASGLSNLKSKWKESKAKKDISKVFKDTRYIEHFWGRGWESGTVIGRSNS
eukprot:sb/3465246/